MMHYSQKYFALSVALVPLTSHVGIASLRAEVKDLVNPQTPLFFTPTLVQAQTSQEKNDLAQLKLAQIPDIPQPQPLPKIEIPTIPQQINIPKIEIPTIPQQINIPKIEEILPSQPVPKIEIPTIPQQNYIPTPIQLPENLLPQPQPLPQPSFLPTFPLKKSPGQEDMERNIREFEQEQERMREQLQQRQVSAPDSLRRYEEKLQKERLQCLELQRLSPEKLPQEVQVVTGLHQKGANKEALKRAQCILDGIIVNLQRKKGNPPDTGTTLTLLTFTASIYNSLGGYSKALKLGELALAIQKQINDQKGEILTLQTLGLTHYNLGQYSKALNLYQQALTIAKESNSKLKEGQILVDIGSVRVRQGDYSQALELYEKCLTIINQIRDQQQAIESSEDSENIGSEDIVSKVAYNLEKGIVLSLEKGGVISLNEFNPILDKELHLLEGQALSRMGEAYQNLGNYSQALELYQKALKIQKEMNNKPEESRTLRNIGTVYFNQGDYSQALDYYQQSLKIAKKTNDKAGEGASLSNIGFLYNTLGKYLDAEKTLLAAVQAWESLRGGLSDDQKISIFERQVGSYQFLQQSLVAQNKTSAALEIAERSRARAFVDLLASRLSSASNNQTSIKPPNIKQIQQIAQRYSATIVQYSIINAQLTEQGKEESRPSLLYIWVVKPTGKITFKQVDLKSSLNVSFVDLVDQSRNLIGTRGRGITVVPHDASAKNQRQNSLQQLHQILIQPIASELPQNPNEYVIFVPQSELFFLPFAALQDEEGKYLIEKHTILTTPAIQVLQLTHQQKIENVKATTTKRPLVVGNPTMPNVAQEVGEQPQQLSSLPGAKEEALQIAQTLNTQSLTGSSATETIIKRLMGSAGIVHLATHGLLDDFQEFGIPGAIALAPSDKDDGLLTSNEIFDMKLNADLVVLSACDTGRGHIKGDGVIGLSRSFIAAGVPSVIVSLWAVSDDSTAFLMTNFYQNLKQNPNKATALRSAMLTTMKKYPEPLNWAAFTLIGETE